jgi:probable rRNA maturation factor
VKNTPSERVIELFIDKGDDLSSALSDDIPQQRDIETWLHAALSQIQYTKPIEINIRVVSSAESQQLNRDYRNKDKPTNVLSFESDIPDFVPSSHIGDLAICAEVLHHEAKEQNKELHAHWAHMCVHGLLHLLGYDHIDEDDAVEMEAIEIASLAAIGIDDPYAIR